MKSVILCISALATLRKDASLSVRRRSDFALGSVIAPPPKWVVLKPHPRIGESASWGNAAERKSTFAIILLDMCVFDATLISEEVQGALKRGQNGLQPAQFVAGFEAGALVVLDDPAFRVLARLAFEGPNIDPRCMRLGME
jgi:hypothetical protein